MKSRTFVDFIVVTLISFGTQGCNQLDFGVSSSSSNSLSGSIENLGGSFSKVNRFQTCTSGDGTVELYSLDSLGQKDKLLKEAEVDDEGKFRFTNIKEVGLNFDHELETTSFALFYSCENQSYQRFVTGPEDQVVSDSTTLFSWLVESGVQDKVFSQSASTWTHFYDSLLSAQSQTEAFSILNSDPQLKAKFSQTFGVEPEVFLEVPPKIRAVSVPKSFDEVQPQNFNVEAYHWSADYNIAYLWKVSSQTLSQSSNFSYTSSANAQGQYSLQLFVGKDSGGGTLDTSAPYTQETFSFQIQNTSPAVPPQLEKTSAKYTSSKTIGLRINTGSLIDQRPQFCSSFSKMALMEEAYPGTGMAPTQPLSYEWDCDTANYQDVSFELDGVEGHRLIHLWAIDSSNNVSLTSTSVDVIYDVTKPLVTLTSLNSGEKLKGGEAIDIKWSVTDDHLGSTPVALEYSVNDGVSWSSLASDLAAADTYTWTLPQIDSAEVRVRVSASDKAGNADTAVSLSAVTIDSTAPNAPAISLTSADLSNDRNVSLSVTCDVDYDKVLIAESNVAPTANDARWQECAAALSYEVSAGDGEKTLYVWSIDDVQNISTSSSSLSVVLDQTAPLLAWVTSLSEPLKGGDNLSFEFSVSELHMTTSEKFIVFYSLNGGTDWTQVAALPASSGPLTLAQVSYNFSLPGADSQSFRLKVQAEDSLGNQSSLVTSDLVLDSTPPVLSSVILNGGVTSTSFSFISIKVEGSDNLSGLDKIRFADTSSSGDCQSLYNDTFWMSWVNADTALSYNMSPVDGNRKVCAWAKDTVGNISVIDPSTGNIGVDSNVIDYFVGNPPVITSLEVINGSGSADFNTGEPVYVNWTLTDVEGLSDSPLDFYVSVNGGAWAQIASQVGGLAGQPTSASGTFSGYNAPSGVFRIKAVATDTNGNTSIAALSSVMNSLDWSVYMGSSEKGVGGKGTSLSMFKKTYGVAANQFAMNPLNGDIYAVSSDDAVYKLDSQTGKTSVFIVHGSSNFSEGRLISDGLVANSANLAINFDKAGRLYISNPEGVGSGSQNSIKIWQLDFANDRVSLYAGGGTAPETSSTMPNSAFDLRFGYGSYDIDDSGAMYFVSECDTSTFVAGTKSLAYRILKMAQNPDGTAGEIEWLAGDCSDDVPMHGAEAKSSGLDLARYRHIRHIAVNGDGSLIYIAESGTSPSTYKIALDSETGVRKIYHTSIGGKGIVFDRFNNQLFAASGSVVKVTLPSDPSGAEVITEYISDSGTGDCNSDGVKASLACINAYGSNGWAPLEIANDGSLLFTDNLFRIRYIDANSELRTLMGTQPFYGEDLHRSLARGNFTGIHYKTSETNTDDYPKGLYFVEDNGGVLGYVDPTSGVISVIAGNQQQINGAPPDGSVVSRNTNLGSKGNTNFQGLDFDSDGFPIIILEGQPRRIGAGKVINRLSTGNDYWHLSNDGDPLSNVRFASTWAYGNLAMFGTGYLFSMGVNTSETRGDLFGGISFLDLTTSTLRILMKGLTPSGQVAAPDSSSPSVVNMSSLASTCRNNFGCFVQINSHDSDLYFSEDHRIRRLTSPTDPSAVTLESPVELDMGRTVRNFSFSPDNNRVFYIASNGSLYCKWIGAGVAPDNCTNSLLGPGVGFSNLSALANQLTFISDGKLLISNGPEIYQYSYVP